MKLATALMTALALASFAACREAQPAHRPELQVYAAASLRDVLAGEEARLERELDVDLIFNFGSSGDLARQISAAGKADVFFSAGTKEMDDLEREHLIVAGTRTERLSNRLVVIEPREGPSSFTVPFRVAALGAGGIERLSLAETSTVPAGRYAKAWLEATGTWPTVAARVLPGIDARAALAAVESGAAQAGIVYATDARRSTRVRIVHEVPDGEGPRIVYPLAAIARRPHEARARALVVTLSAKEMLAAFERCGFVVAPPSGRSGRGS